MLFNFVIVLLEEILNTNSNPCPVKERATSL